MKRIFTILTAMVFMLLSYSSEAQRYDEEIFTDVTVTSNVLYGFNGTVITVPSTGSIFKQPLVMDVYEPDGDTQTERPLVLVFHTGNFLPNVTNGQIAGTKTDSSAVEICTQLARRGFVAASVSYRGGWNPLAETQPERALGLIQAAYRGIQDGRAAIRYFKKDAEGGNQFGVDDSKITCWGLGTGGYLVLGLASLDDFQEIITTTNGPGKFLLDLFIGPPSDGVPGQDGVPDTPMIAPPHHGDVNGEVLTIVPDANFGLPPGDTSNYVNHPGYSNDFQLAVNIGGALGDVSWLADQTIPIISVQSINDIFAPYDDAVLIVPTTGDPIARVQGLQQIGAIQEASGINQGWKDLNLNDAVTMAAQDGAAMAGHDYYEGSFSWFKPPNSNGIDEGVVINWWDPSALSPPILPDFPNGVPWNQLPHPSGGTFHDQGLALNEGMSAEKSRANIAEVMAYVIPRACKTLALGCESTNVNEVKLADNLVAVAPNPALGFVTVSTDNNETLNRIEVYNMDGKLMSSITDINQTHKTIELNNQASGMYIMKVYLENGFVTKKLMLK